MQSRSLARLSRQGFEGGLNTAASTSIVASQRPRNAVISEGAFVARFSQCAGDVLGNALPLLFNFWVKLRRVGLARRRLPNVPHDTTPPITAQEHRPVAMVGDWEAESNSRIRYENSVHANWMCAGSFWCGAAKMLRFQCGATVHFEVHIRTCFARSPARNGWRLGKRSKSKSTICCHAEINLRTIRHTTTVAATEFIWARVV